MLVSDQLREAIEAADVTLYRIAKDARVDWGTLQRFVTGERPNISAVTIDKLCDCLGLELCEKSARKKPARKAKRSAKKK